MIINKPVAKMALKLKNDMSVDKSVDLKISTHISQLLLLPSARRRSDKVVIDI